MTAAPATPRYQRIGWNIYDNEMGDDVLTGKGQQELLDKVVAMLNPLDDDENNWAKYAGESDKTLDELAGALDGLLDGLDDNTDGRDGLSQEAWLKRIQSARETLSKVGAR